MSKIIINVLGNKELDCPICGGREFGNSKIKANVESEDYSATSYHDESKYMFTCLRCGWITFFDIDGDNVSIESY